MRQQSPPHQVRIIAGQWRGRRLPVVDEPGLRPTGDRVRETLFNWLAPIIHGRRCLDLFAGSGALGLEALSRGAGEVVFIERSKLALDALQSATHDWPGIERAEFVQADALAWLKATHAPFDGIFIDPPFDARLHQAALSAVVDGGLLKPGGWVYLEAPKGDASGLLAACPKLSVERHKTVGQVDMVLLRYHSGPDST